MLHAPQVALAPQVCLPAAHLPTNPPSEQGRCCPCTQGQPSFTTPLQVSSLPGVQVSLPFAWTLHAPQCRSAPHVCVPAAQLPSARRCTSVVQQLCSRTHDRRKRTHRRRSFPLRRLRRPYRLHRSCHLHQLRIPTALHQPPPNLPPAQPCSTRPPCRPCFSCRLSRSLRRRLHRLPRQTHTFWSRSRNEIATSRPCFARLQTRLPRPIDKRRTWKSCFESSFRSNRPRPGASCAFSATASASGSEYSN